MIVIGAALALAAALALGALAPACALADDGNVSGDAKVCVDEVSLASIGQSSSAATHAATDSTASFAEGDQQGQAADAATVPGASAAASLSLPRFAPSVLGASCSPEVIEVGKDCGMDWMCGITPCLCGSSDSWGGCSCNGLEQARPSVSAISSDEGVVRVVEAFGKTWLLPCGSGEADVTITPSLRYHTSVPVTVHITVAGLQTADAFLGFFAVLIVAIVAGSIIMHKRIRKMRGSE